MRGTCLRAALALLFCLLIMDDCAVALHAPPAASACVHAAPRLLLQHEREQLCALAGVSSTAPARCATAALRATSAFPAVSTQQRAAMVFSLCARASDTGPAHCWLALPHSVRQQLDLAPTLLRVCENATDTRPAECFVAWRKLAAFSSKRTIQDTTPVVTELCRAFRGDVDTLTACAQQAPQALAPVIRLEMCRHATSADKLNAIRACARQLVADSVPAAAVARMCAVAELTASPRACVVASACQLRWMDLESRTYLCERSESAEPVQCAAELRRTFPSSLSIAGRDETESQLAHAAVLCHATRDASAVVACVSKVPARAFSLQQLVGLCSGQAHAAASQCVMSAKRMLSVSTLTGTSRESADLLFALCANATSAAPLDCMIALQRDTTLLMPQRVALCRTAHSSSPHACYTKLRPLIHTKKVSPRAALALCSHAYSLAPALCVTELAKVASTAFMELHGASLCANATNSAPVQCYRAAPSAFTDCDKCALCQLADSDAPAVCARNPITRVATAHSKAELCHRAQSSAPAACAMAAPFGMRVADIITLCRFATSDMPARCARGISILQHVSFDVVAELCADARSTTPASCLAQHIRQRRDVTRELVLECQRTVPMPNSLEIAHVAYECPQLVSGCRLSIHLRVLDQFGDEMPAWSTGYLYISATPADGTVLETTSPERVLLGASHAPLLNGTAMFHDLSFAEPGEFVVAFRSSSASPHVQVAEKIARIRIHEDVHERLRTRRCSALFISRFECSAALSPTASQLLEDAIEPSRFLELPMQRYLDVLECERYWRDHLGGLRLLGATSTRFVFAIHRAAYRFLTDTSVPSAEMSAWACLGLAEGATRSQIRHAYHLRSLEWHPDKWSSPETVSLRARAEQVYAQVTHAYNELFYGVSSGAGNDDDEGKNTRTSKSSQDAKS